MSILPTSPTSQQHYDLYERYINERRADGDMYPATLDRLKIPHSQFTESH